MPTHAQNGNVKPPMNQRLNPLTMTYGTST